MAAVNWSREETFKLISLWSEDVIQQQLEGCRRNSTVFRKIADGLSEGGFTRTLEQCRDKIKKLKAEYKKIRDKRDTTGQGRYPEWEYFDAMNEVMAAKHSTEPPVVVESFSDSQTVDSLGHDDTQDMSEGAASYSEGSTSPATSHASGHSSSSNSSSSGTDNAAMDGDTQTSGGKGKKRKLGKREATNELFDKMIELQAKSDRLMVDLEEKRMRLEERQMECDAQMRREVREFQFQMMQMFTRFSVPHHGPPPPHYSPFSSFGPDYDPDAT